MGWPSPGCVRPSSSPQETWLGAEQPALGGCRSAEPHLLFRMSFSQLAVQLAEISRQCYARGWAPGTSGNFSATVSRDPLRLAITASGIDKGTLTPADIVEIDGLGAWRRAPVAPRPSRASTWRSSGSRGAGAVLHTHSIWSTILSEAASGDGLAIQGYEMLKGLGGVAHPRAPRMAAHSGEHPGLGRGRAGGRGDAGRASGCARVPDPPARALHLGPGPRRGEAALGDAGVSVRGDRKKARMRWQP